MNQQPAALNSPVEEGLFTGKGSGCGLNGLVADCFLEDTKISSDSALV